MNFKYILILFGVAVMFSCTEDFDEINENPNEPTNVPNEYLLTSAQKSFMDNTIDEWWNGRRGNQLAQFWASNQYSSESRYAFRTGITNTYWSLFYSGSTTISSAGGGIVNLEQIITNNQETPTTNSQNQIAVAKILKAWMYQMMTDCWGSIPLSAAIGLDKNPSPAYDSQESVYSSLITMLSEAVNSIDVSVAGPDGDAIYNGDMVKWKKFGNSLKMRVALRMADVNSGAASTAVSEAFESGVMESNADNALFDYFSGAPNNNPINEDRKTRNDFAASNIMVDKLLELNDPRIDYYYEPAVETGEYVGEIYGLTEAKAAETPDAVISQRSEKVLAAEFPGIYMDYAQVEFMLAEAVERGYISGSAADHYNAGIRASMNWWSDGSLSSGDIDNYIAQDGVDYDNQVGQSSWRETIGAQKWIALYMQGIEGWTEFRRLDFGILQPPADGALQGTGIPERMLYPLDEYSRNSSNVKAAVSQQGPDVLDTKLWWDVN